MKIYTRKGDKGITGLMGPTRVVKSHQRVEVYGSLDELNAVLGWVRTQEIPAPWDKRILIIQKDLFTIGTYLALDPKQARPSLKLPTPPQHRIEEMEDWIDELDANLPSLEQFILPGGVPSASALHLARAVCRRVERRAVALHIQEPLSEWILAYINRLSDLLFMLARWLNHTQNVEEIPWVPENPS